MRPDLLLLPEAAQIIETTLVVSGVFGPDQDGVGLIAGETESTPPRV